MSAYRAGLADMGGSFQICMFDLPGCMVTGARREEALAIAPVVVAEHAGWLTRHGIAHRAGDRVELEIVEEVRADASAAADGEFCFADDLVATSAEDIELGIRTMTASRDDLLDVLNACPEAVLNWRPPLSAMARIDEWKPQPLTIREIAADVAGAESYYRRGLEDGKQEHSSDAEPPQLDIERMLLIDALRSLSPDDLGRRFEPQRPWQSSPEHWTARKVLRRVISHERFHTAEVQQRLAWLQLGVPRIRD
jgi:hypothetical protein